MLNEYRPIMADGSVAERKVGAVCTCPLCDTPLKKWDSVAVHLAQRHKIGMSNSVIVSLKTARRTGKYMPGEVQFQNVVRYQCFGCKFKAKNVRGLYKHLSHVVSKGEWKTHVVQAAAKVAFNNYNQPKGIVR